MSNKDLVTVEEKSLPETRPAEHGGLQLALLLEEGKFELIQRVASLYAKSDFVPDHFKDKIPNVAIALLLAHRLGCDPFMLMQNCYLHKGQPGFEAKFVIALVNNRGIFQGPIEYLYEGEGEGRQCTAFAVHRNGAKLQATVTWAMVKAEGWIRNAKWSTMTDQMFAYRSAMFLVRRYCPEVIFGLQTIDELYDIEMDKTRRDGRVVWEVPDAKEVQPDPPKKTTRGTPGKTGKTLSVPGVDLQATKNLDQKGGNDEGQEGTEADY